MIDEQGDGHAEQQAEGGGRECTQREALQHLVHGDQQPAEPEPDDHAEDGGKRHADEFRPHLADGVAAGSAEAQEEDADCPERHKINGPWFSVIAGPCPAAHWSWGVSGSTRFPRARPGSNCLW